MSAAESVDRRGFLRGSGAALLGAAALGGCGLVQRGTSADVRGRFGGRRVASTWDFGVRANAAAWAALAAGVAHPVHAAVAGARVPEADPEVTSVGYGGAPNADGVMELDACVMRGDTLGCGGVAGLQGIAHPVSVALDVMEHTPHVLLVGDGARAFALERGHAEAELLSPAAAGRWERWKEERARPAPVDDHDTIGMIVLDGGRFGVAVTTSGWAFKRPGRVGDSPIIGAGAYADDAAGACVATGTGEEMIRHAASFAVVEQLRHGATAHQAVVAVLDRVRANLRARGEQTMVALLAMDRAGRTFGACTTRGFQYALLDDDGERLLDGPVLVS